MFFKKVELQATKYSDIVSQKIKEVNFMLAQFTALKESPGYGVERGKPNGSQSTL